ncbi:MAG: NADP-dependent phosphogluconate dehydrogenase [Chloroflexi bacterium]|nr:NADP-dependent phosphogluconate dehydrogenase [Chloroflexota bacterium]
MPATAAAGLIGLGVMGRNLALNIASRGFPLAVYNRTYSRTTEFLEREASETDIRGVEHLDDFVDALERPRRVILMVDAGRAVDAVLDQLIPLLDPGDTVVDGGNSFYVDTERRIDVVEGARMRYLGTGISGGETGARYGPSIMPGGDEDAYARLEPILTRIAAQVDDGPCVTHVGRRSAGHYVKMVHNGIEYGDMQLIAEAYSFLAAAGYRPDELAGIFSAWNETDLESYLIEITADIFRVRDADGDGFLVDAILDQAGQKGTGRWTSRDALDLGTPIPTIDAAVWSRHISALKDERVAAAPLLRPDGAPRIERFDGLVEAVRLALYAAKVCSYAQGMSLLRAASEAYAYELEPAELARIWKGGCIIRARLLGDIQRAFASDPLLVNLLLDEEFRSQLAEADESWRRVVTSAKNAGLPFAAMSASLDYYDAYRSDRLPMNLTQAQRDYFGAHTYRRVDRQGVFHTQWEQGADTGAASSNPADA